MTRPLELGSTRYGIHKETDSKTEAFMLTPKEIHWLQMLKENLGIFKEPSQEEVNLIRRKYPHVSAMLESFISNEFKTYANPSFIVYRNSIYVQHLYQFVRNDHSKLEIAAVFDPKRRSREAVERELKLVMDKATSSVPHVDFFHHSLK